MTDAHLPDGDRLAVLERYLDTVPRAFAEALACGPFSVFVAREGWPYYARPRLGLAVPIEADDVRAVIARMQDLRMPASIEWMQETTPSLADAATAAGLRVEDMPLLVLDGDVRTMSGSGARVAVVGPGDERFASARAAVAAGFDGRDELTPEPVADWIAARVDAGLMRVVGAFAPDGSAVGGGSHAPRDGVTELTGIAVVPSWRRRGVGAELTRALAQDARSGGATTVFLSAGSDDVARVYERVGFARVGSVCAAAPTQ
ncbi:MAG: GNAT family N-acetyltransferase [Nocardioidaceae bacterium]